MQVTAVIPLYPPKSLVGSWIGTHLFLRHLVAVGHDVLVIASNLTGPGWVHEGVKVETASRGYPWIREQATSADVVLTHFGYSKAAKQSGRPSVQMVHGFIYRAPRSADLLVFNSQASRDACLNVGPAVVCPPPTDPSEHRVESTGDCVTLVNCSPPKGIHTFGEVAARLPHCSFLGVTGGYDDQLVPDLANVKVWPSQRDMRRVWERTRVLVMPSEYETWGMVGIEAMCSGIPVIASPTPGLRESLGDAGIFVDRDDTEGWVREIERLHDPTEYALASKRALARVDELDPQASLDRFVKALCEVTRCG